MTGPAAALAAPAPGSSSDGAARFEVGRDYTRAEIHAALGGSRRACLPTRDGRVVAACLLRSLNPDAPHVLLAGTGVRNEPAGALLAVQGGAVPFFTRVAVHRWRYEGLFAVAEVVEAGARYERLVAASGRPPASVSRVLLLRAA